MKKILCILFAFFSFALVCGQTTKIPKGWKENADFQTIDRNNFYIHRSGIDSIVVLTSQPLEKYRGGILELSNTFHVFHYQKDRRGLYTEKDSDSTHDVHTIQKDGDTQMIGIQKLIGSGKILTKKINYTLRNDGSIIFFNLPLFGELNPAKEFSPIKVDAHSEKQYLKGGWYNTSVVDSTVLVFEDSAIKEYLFVKGTSNLVDRWQFDEYTANVHVKYLKGQPIGNAVRALYLGQKLGVSHYDFSSDLNTLTIYWKWNNTEIVYKRITPIKIIK